MSKEVELIKVVLAELKPGHKYIIGLNNQQVKLADMRELSQQIQFLGFRGIVMAFNGDPTTGMHIVEQKDDNVI